MLPTEDEECPPSGWELIEIREASGFNKNQVPRGTVTKFT